MLGLTSHRGRTEIIIASEPRLGRIGVAAVVRGANARAVAQQRLARRHRGTLAWLLASAMAAFGTGDAFPAPRHKPVPTHQGGAAQAQDHKRGSAGDAKRTAAARERNRAANAIPLPTARPATGAVEPPAETIGMG